MLGNNTKRPPEQSDGLALSIQEIFYTLQGEGPFSGQPAVFIRLVGCNLSCYWCDTDFESSSWKPSLEEILKEETKQSAEKSDLVVITGGEPFRQNIAPLVEALLAKGKRVQIETNGTLWVELPKHKNLSIVCSPKTKNLNACLTNRADFYKYVIQAGYTSEEDGLPIASTQNECSELQIARPPKDASVYVMPLDIGDARKNLENQKECINIAKEFNYYVTLQTHKLLSIK